MDLNVCNEFPSSLIIFHVDVHIDQWKSLLNWLLGLFDTTPVDFGSFLVGQGIPDASCMFST